MKHLNGNKKVMHAEPIYMTKERDEIGVDFAHDLLPWDEVGVMLGFGDEHHVPATDVRAPPRACHEVQRLGGTAEHHQLFGGNPEE